MGYEYITAGQTDGHSYRLTGTFVNSNNLSALINLSIAAGLALVIYVEKQHCPNKFFYKNRINRVIGIRGVNFIFWTCKSRFSRWFIIVGFSRVSCCCCFNFQAVLNKSATEFIHFHLYCAGGFDFLR